MSDRIAAPPAPGSAAALRRPETLTSAVAGFIRDAIVRGDYAPGTRLSEAALARELQTSRGTVREAIRALADRGLVEVHAHRGAFVTQLSVRATWEITSLRALLEPYASRLALEADDGGRVLAEASAALEALAAAVATGDPVEVADADVAFHRAVFARCGHTMLLTQLETLQSLSRRIVLTNQISSADAPTLVAQHRPILDAVARHDPVLLETAVRTHVIEAGELLMTRMAPLDHRHPRHLDGATFGVPRWPSGQLPRPRSTAGVRTGVGS